MSIIKIDIITALAETFGRKLSAPAAKLYIVALAGLSDEEATRAATVAVQTCKFFPAAAELIELARTGGVGYETQALLAFEELNAALSQDKPSMLSPLTAAVARTLGTWGDLRDLALTEFHTWKRKDFIAAFISLARENPQRVAALAGPTSEIGAALASAIKRVTSREDEAAIEKKNRQQLQSLRFAGDQGNNRSPRPDLLSPPTNEKVATL